MVKATTVIIGETDIQNVYPSLKQHSGNDKGNLTTARDFTAKAKDLSTLKHETEDSKEYETV